MARPNTVGGSAQTANNVSVPISSVRENRSHGSVGEPVGDHRLYPDHSRAKDAQTFVMVRFPGLVVITGGAHG
ncbi:MAG TPA: hypothetical protein PLW35_04065 [Verrucomicrobiota bacterium]|nr:hypothetical protein [Verrucomicrobiota bacterium]